MVKTIILNSSNVIKDGSNSSYIYRFPTATLFNDGDQIAIQSIVIPYSWFNISSAYNNNLFYYLINGTQYAVNLPDGFYDIVAINNILQQTQIANGHYLLNASGDYITYVQFRQNLSKYANEIDCFPISQTLPTGYTNPANVFYNSITFSSSNTPQINISSNNFGSIIGFLSGNYPSTPQNSTYYQTSNTIPNASPVNAIVITANMIDNKYANPNNIFYSFSSNSTSFGSNININSSALAWVDINPGTYPNLRFDFLDQNFSKIYMNDYNLCVQVLIRNKNER